MVTLSKKIRDLFYNPEADSISSLLQDIKNTHDEILKITDLSKCTLSSKSEYAESAIQDFKIPSKGISKKQYASLIAELFQGVCRWHSPNSMYNVVSSPVLPTIAAKTFTALYNPNLCLDTACGDSLIIEQKVIKSIAKYIGWDWQGAGGAFTWGGKATIMYGIKLGLKNCSPESSEKGVKEDIIVLSTASGHPAHKQDVDWLGIGINNMYKIKNGKDSRVDLIEMERVIRETPKPNRAI
jgi:glutamate/tyrosine decarboxylase-like PLP-dependent enzyme